MKLRSLLYVPASSERFISKAHERSADAVILDLEDSVVEADKDGARKNLAEAVASVGRNGARVFVRINSEPERRHLDAEAACRAGAFGLFIPKAHEIEDFWALDENLERIERQAGREAIRFVPLIETPASMLAATPLARFERVLGLACGGEDMALALGAQPLPEVLHLPKLLVHYTAKAEGKLSFGLLRSIADYTDIAGIEAAAAEARRHGFDGATCVHPAVVPLLNAAFSPSAEDIAWAERVVAAAAETGQGAFSLDGKMVDAPVIARAQAILAKR
jgi:citrate lyase subunit beta/citryl-CoA lyase